jgi:hypothetical protein
LQHIPYHLILKALGAASSRLLFGEVRVVVAKAGRRWPVKRPNQPIKMVKEASRLDTSGLALLLNVYPNNVALF